MQLLLIEGDEACSGWLGERLANLGFLPRSAASPEQALREGLAERVAAMIVEVGPAGPDGPAIVRSLRQHGLTQPLIVLSARGDWRDKVESLDAGADDYLAKPVRSEEIAARLRAIFRRCAGSATDQIISGAIELDLKARCAWLAGECLNLTRNEFRLLQLFLLHPEQVLTHREIRARLYAGDATCSLNAVEVQVARLRRKVGRDRIRTVRGVGYQYVAEPASSQPPACPRGPCKAMGGEQCCIEADPTDYFPGLRVSELGCPL